MKTSKTLQAANVDELVLNLALGLVHVRGYPGRNLVKAKKSIQDVCQGLIFDEKITMLHVDLNDGHNIAPIVFLLGRNITKYKDIPNGGRLADIEHNSKWLPGGFFLLIFHSKNNIFASLSKW